MDSSYLLSSGQPDSSISRTKVCGLAIYNTLKESAIHLAIFFAFLVFDGGAIGLGAYISYELGQGYSYLSCDGPPIQFQWVVPVVIIALLMAIFFAILFYAQGTEGCFKVMEENTIRIALKPEIVIYATDSLLFLTLTCGVFAFCAFFLHQKCDNDHREILRNVLLSLYIIYAFLNIFLRSALNVTNIHITENQRKTTHFWRYYLLKFALSYLTCFHISFWFITLIASDSAGLQNITDPTTRHAVRILVTIATMYNFNCFTFFIKKNLSPDQLADNPKSFINHVFFPFEDSQSDVINNKNDDDVDQEMSLINNLIRSLLDDEQEKKLNEEVPMSMGDNIAPVMSNLLSEKKQWELFKLNVESLGIVCAAKLKFKEICQMEERILHEYTVNNRVFTLPPTNRIQELSKLINKRADKIPNLKVLSDKMNHHGNNGRCQVRFFNRVATRSDAMLSTEGINLLKVHLDQTCKLRSQLCQMNSNTHLKMLDDQIAQLRIALDGRMDPLLSVVIRSPTSTHLAPSPSFSNDENSLELVDPYFTRNPLVQK